MKRPAITILSLFLIILFIEALDHGKTKTGSAVVYNFWTTLPAAALVLFILYMGGFFDVLLD